MLKDQTNKWLRKSIKMDKRILFDFIRYRYFWSDEVDFDEFRKEVINRLTHQLKIMQDELDARLGRS